MDVSSNCCCSRFHSAVPAVFCRCTKKNGRDSFGARLRRSRRIMATPLEEATGVERQAVLLQRRVLHEFAVVRQDPSQRLVRAGSEARPDRMAVHDRVLDDDVRADRHERRVADRILGSSSGRRCREPRMTNARGSSPVISRTRAAAASLCGRSDTYVMRGCCGRSPAGASLDGDDLPVPEQIADAREEQRPTAGAGAGLDDPVGPHASRSTPGTRRGRSVSSATGRPSQVVCCQARLFQYASMNEVLSSSGSERGLRREPVRPVDTRRGRERFRGHAARRASATTLARTSRRRSGSA